MLQTCTSYASPAAEDVADLLAREQRGRGPADVARLEPVALRRGEVDLDLDLRNVVLELDVQVDEAVDLGDDVPAPRPPCCRRTSRSVAEDAHDDRLARARQHLVDPLVQVGLDVAEEPG